jgi:hypothetical protein
LLKDAKHQRNGRNGKTNDAMGMQIAVVFLRDHGRSMASIALKLFGDHGSECNAPS